MKKKLTKPIIDNNEELSCKSKKQYWSENDALVFCDVIGKQLNVYKCKYCGFWHLTSRSRR